MLRQGSGTIEVGKWADLILLDADPLNFRNRAKLVALQLRVLCDCIGAPAETRTPNQQIMRRFEGYQQDETK